MSDTRDHGGGLDAAIARFGGTRDAWLDLSTGINPIPYPIHDLGPGVWTDLPDRDAFDRLIALARSCWAVPDEADVLPAGGASALIAAMPQALQTGSIGIPGPTYNEHAAAFALAGWDVSDRSGHAQVIVHPNNPTGRLWQAAEVTTPYVIIDESFCDVTPDQSLMQLASRPGVVILKSFGKFWGLAGLRLGFAIGDPSIIGRLRDLLGPWQVSGPALAIGAEALSDHHWADETRSRLSKDAARLDRLMDRAGAEQIGGTTLFRLYRVKNATDAQNHLAEHKIWSRIFPYSDDWLRLGLPPTDRWDQLEAAF